MSDTDESVLSLSQLINHGSLVYRSIRILWQTEKCLLKTVWDQIASSSHFVVWEEEEGRWREGRILTIRLPLTHLRVKCKISVPLVGKIVWDSRSLDLRLRPKLDTGSQEVFNVRGVWCYKSGWSLATMSFQIFVTVPHGPKRYPGSKLLKT